MINDIGRGYMFLTYKFDMKPILLEEGAISGASNSSIVPYSY